MKKGKETSMSELLRATTCLRKRLGEQRFKVLIDPENTESVERLCDQLLIENTSQNNSSPPKMIKMTIGSYTYVVIDFLKEWERREGRKLSGIAVVDRADDMRINTGRNHGNHILRHQCQIPVDFRKYIFVFPQWRHRVYDDGARCIHWDKDVGEWTEYLCSIDSKNWGGAQCFLRCLDL